MKKELAMLLVGVAQAEAAYFVRSGANVMVICVPDGRPRVERMMEEVAKLEPVPMPVTAFASEMVGMEYLLEPPSPRWSWSGRRLDTLYRSDLRSGKVERLRRYPREIRQPCWKRGRWRSVT